jgi:RNA polymerase-associated protein LEO1
MASSEDDVLENGSIADDDLFGSEDDATDNKVRELSDRELDSGDDEDRDDRVRAKSQSGEIEDGPPAPSRVLDVTVCRHPLPKPADGEVRSHSEFRNEA